MTNTIDTDTDAADAVYAILSDCTDKRGTVAKILTADEYASACDAADSYRKALSRRVDGRQMRTDRMIVAISRAIAIGERVWLADAAITSIKSAA